MDYKIIPLLFLISLTQATENATTITTETATQKITSTTTTNENITENIANSNKNNTNAAEVKEITSEENNNHDNNSIRTARHPQGQLSNHGMYRPQVFNYQQAQKQQNPTFNRYQQQQQSDMVNLSKTRKSKVIITYGTPKNIDEEAEKAEKNFQTIKKYLPEGFENYKVYDSHDWAKPTNGDVKSEVNSGSSEEVMQNNMELMNVNGPKETGKSIWETVNYAVSKKRPSKKLNLNSFFEKDNELTAESSFNQEIKTEINREDPNQQGHYIYLQPNILKNNFGLDSKERQEFYHQPTTVSPNGDQINYQALNDLIGKNPNVQIEGLKKLLERPHMSMFPQTQNAQSFHKEVTPESQHGIPDDISNLLTSEGKEGKRPSIKELQAQLDASSKEHTNNVLAKAQEEALAHVEAQHKALALAAEKATSEAFAKIAAQNEGLNLEQPQALALIGTPNQQQDVVYEQQPKALPLVQPKVTFYHPQQPQKQNIIFEKPRQHPILTVTAVPNLQQHRFQQHLAVTGSPDQQHQIYAVTSAPRLQNPQQFIITAAPSVQNKQHYVTEAPIQQNQQHFVVTEAPVVHQKQHYVVTAAPPVVHQKQHYVVTAAPAVQQKQHFAVTSAPINQHNQHFAVTSAPILHQKQHVTVTANPLYHQQKYSTVTSASVAQKLVATPTQQSYIVTSAQSLASNSQNFASNHQSFKIQPAKAAVVHAYSPPHHNIIVSTGKPFGQEFVPNLVKQPVYAPNHHHHQLKSLLQAERTVMAQVKQQNDAVIRAAQLQKQQESKAQVYVHQSSPQLLIPKKNYHVEEEEEEVEDNQYNENRIVTRTPSPDDQYASKYAFGYKIMDGKMGNDFGHEEKREEKMVKGHYHVLLPDGRRQKVEYYADNSGYHAKVSYENVAHH